MSGADGGGQGRREVAHRLFAVEYDDADFEFSESDEERAPNYVVTPTGARVNRLFVVGVLTEVEPVSDDVLRARIVDPTGAFVAYAGQYQPEAVAFLEAAEVPSFVSLTGKARTFQPEGSDQVFTSVRPESITAVDGETRDRWTVQAAEHTLARIATMARALDQEARGQTLTASLRESGVAESLATGIPLAIEHYGTTRGYLSAIRQQAIAATEVVTGDREAVPDLELAPNEDGPVTGELDAAPAVGGTVGGDEALAAAPAPAVESAETAEADEPEPAPEPDAPAATTESRAEPEPTASDDADDDELGDFEPTAVTADSAEPPGDTYDLDEAEREEVEAEFGTEFSSGSEVADPGEAGIEPETEPPAGEEVTDTQPTSAPADTAEPAEEPAAPSDGGDDASAAEASEAAEPGDEPAADVDLEDAAVEAMTELDDGDGADRDAVIESVVEAHGVEAAAVEAAIQDALMGGRCYEPTDGTLKAI